MKFQKGNSISSAEVGIKDSYIKLYRKYHKNLCLFALKFVSNIQCAEDLVQDVFISIWENNSNFDFNDSEHMEHYLFRAVRNNCITYLKRNKTRKNHRDVILLELLNLATDHADHLLDKELSEKINTEITQLPEKSRKIFVLSRMEGLKNKEIANKLELSEKSIEYHITKTLKILREKLVNYVATILVLIQAIRNLF